MHNPSSSNVILWKKLLVQGGIAAVVIAVGIAGGIKLGLSDAVGEASNPAMLRNSTLLDIGESLPNFQLRTSIAAQSKRLTDLLGGAPALLVFASSSCPACEMMFRHWNKRVVPNLDSQTKIVVVYSDEDLAHAVNDPLPIMLQGSVPVLTPRETQSDADGILATPTVIGVDFELSIKFVMSGFDPRVDAKFINEHL